MNDYEELVEEETEEMEVIDFDDDFDSCPVYSVD